MVFSIKNGLKMTGHHLRSSEMIIALIMCSLPALTIFERFGWKSALIYEVCLMLLFILIRCWDDPVKLGYEDAPNQTQGVKNDPSFNIR